MIDFLRSNLRFIEDFFGHQFLDKKSESSLRGTGKGQHPVRYHYRTAKNYFRGLTPYQRTQTRDT
jgi:hypothetical protein